MPYSNQDFRHHFLLTAVVVLSDAWLDEAMTTYMTTEYIRANFPNLYASSYASMTANATSSRPASASVFGGFTNESQYTACIYDSGVQMLTRVRAAMGDANFSAAIRDYYSAFAFKKAAPSDLLAILQKHSQADLGPIFAAYLNY